MTNIKVQSVTLNRSSRVNVNKEKKWVACEIQIEHEHLNEIKKIKSALRMSL